MLTELMKQKDRAEKIHAGSIIEKESSEKEELRDVKGT